MPSVRVADTSSSDMECTVRASTPGMANERSLRTILLGYTWELPKIRGRAETIISCYAEKDPLLIETATSALHGSQQDGTKRRC